MSRGRGASILLLAMLVSAWPDALRAAAPEAVTIMRDAWGVPHVFGEGAHTVERGAYAAGYAQAQDRLFQMDVLRRAATGRLSEMLGPDYLLMDQVVRRDGFTAAEHTRFFRQLAARDRRSLEAYRDGVNAFITLVTMDRTRLPFEFTGT